MNSLFKQIHQWILNTEDHGDILAVHLCKILGYLRLWFTEEGSQRATLLDKFVSLIYPHGHLILFASFFLHNLENTDFYPLNVRLQIMAYTMTSITLYYGWLTFFRTRCKTTEVIAIVNEKNWAILERTDYIKFRAKRKRIFVQTAVLCFACTLSGVSSSLPIIVKMVTSGEVLYKTNFPIEVVAKSWQAHLQNGFHCFVVMCVAEFYALFLCMYIEIYLRIAFLFSVLANDFEELWTKKDLPEIEESRKFKDLLKEYQELKRCVKIANEVLSAYLNAFITLVYLTLGICAGLIVSLDSMWEVAQFIFFPMYLYLFMAAFCYLGQHVMDSGDLCRDAIYNCNWSSAPLKMQKLVQLFLNECSVPVKVDSKPFYELNFMLLTKITKTSFTVIALVKEMAKK